LSFPTFTVQQPPGPGSDAEQDISSISAPIPRATPRTPSRPTSKGEWSGTTTSPRRVSRSATGA
jgi:hypothetical protein